MVKEFKASTNPSFLNEFNGAFQNIIVFQQEVT